MLVATTLSLLSGTGFGYQTTQASLNMAERNGPQLSQIFFDFGHALAGSPVVRTVGEVVNRSGQPVNLRAVVEGSTAFAIASGVDGSCGATLAAHSRCPLAVQFGPGAGTKGQQVAVLHVGTGSSLLSGAEILAGESRVLEPGTVSSTANAQVAQYTLRMPYRGTWSVSFGTTTAYGRTTAVTADLGAKSPTSVYVAGMLPNTTYHMQATVTLANGVTATDGDHTFTTGALPAGVPATLPVQRTAGATPQPGVELVNTLVGAIATGALVTDLDGNVIWAYQFPDRAMPAELYPIRQLPSGHFLAMIAPVYPALPAAGALNVIREFDLAGTTVQELGMTDLNARLAAKGFPLVLSAFSHDIQALPNGHFLVIANAIKPFQDLPGYPGVTNVGGDVVVDLDGALQPVWVWNSFDHLDVNRHPWNFPDWTHANSVAYSKDDGNFVISLRHQNWVVKVDYRDGRGTGDVLWHLGQGGDFALLGGTDPTDWFYAQHYAQYVSPNTTGVFRMVLLDNGDDRQLPSGTICGPLDGQTPCHYSAVMELQVDEELKTAKFLFHDVLPVNLYSAFAGSTDLLANGDFAFNLAGVGSSAYTFEVKPGAQVTDAPQVVWQMSLPGTNTYRTTRLSSLYPGVQW